jgi:hypothetical protein
VEQRRRQRGGHTLEGIVELTNTAEVKPAEHREHRNETER